MTMRILSELLGRRADAAYRDDDDQATAPEAMWRSSSPSDPKDCVPQVRAALGDTRGF